MDLLHALKAGLEVQDALLQVVLEELGTYVLGVLSFLADAVSQVHNHSLEATATAMLCFTVADQMRELRSIHQSSSRLFLPDCLTFNFYFSLYLWWNRI